ncbi:FbpB family small basic protein [Ectobacillus sp. sgz5001026]
MRQSHRKTFEELVIENRIKLLADHEAIRKIEERIETRLEMRNQA